MWLSVIYKNIKMEEIKTFFKTKTKKKKSKWSQKEMFIEIWNDRDHNCIDCWRLLHTPKPHNFDHIKSKWSRPDLKYDKDNIQIVCFKCHFFKTNKLIYKWPDLDG
jgi:5-methylcytosine-specific restriction endonuclease McrA